jgi:hypothetical protein
MDMEEVQKWILPSDYDHTEAEAKHLVSTYMIGLIKGPLFYTFLLLLLVWTAVGPALPQIVRNG